MENSKRWQVKCFESITYAKLIFRWPDRLNQVELVGLTDNISHYKTLVSLILLTVTYGLPWILCSNLLLHVEL